MYNVTMYLSNITTCQVMKNARKARKQRTKQEGPAAPLPVSNSKAH